MRAHRFTFAPSFAARISVAALFGLALAHAPALAGWSAEPVRIYTTGSLIPLIKACSDGDYGTIVAWQEEGVATPRVLRAQHLLATGDLDPAWPEEGAIVCSVDVPRSGLFAISDHLGGAYLVWNEGSSLFATRIGGDGATATGWPLRGRQLGSTLETPSVIEDGGTGFFAAWVTINGGLQAIHLGPANSGAGGWPNGTRGIGPATEQPTIAVWPRLWLAPDGGIFVAYGYWSAGSDSLPGAYRLRRLTSAGVAASGWGVGIDLGEWQRVLFDDLGSRLVAVCSDGRGGAFVLVGSTQDAGYYNSAIVDYHLFRRQGDGQTAADWPVEGRTIASSWFSEIGPGGSVAIVPDGFDGAYVGRQFSYTDVGISLQFHELSATGDWVEFAASAEPYEDVEILPGEGGGLFIASFKPKGPSSQWEADAFVGFMRAPASFGFRGWSESHGGGPGLWYGGVALASSGDGGVVFFWSQMLDRYGLFARRFSPAGEVTAVESSAPAAFVLHGLRFMRGSGVHASVTMPAAGSAKFELFDVAGRKWALRSFDCSRGSNALTLPGTASLPAGLFFARVIANDHALTGKIVVTR